MRPDALAAHVSDHASTWAGKTEVPLAQVLQMYLAPLDKLGLHWQSTWHRLSADISSFIAADPINAVAQATGHGAQISDESDAITVAPVGITIEDLEPDQRAQGNTNVHTPHELLSKNGKLLVLCSEDGVLSKNEYLCQISCKWLCGNDGQAEMAKVRDQSRRWALTTDCPITLQLPKRPAAGWDAKLTTLKDISNIMNADKK